MKLSHFVDAIIQHRDAVVMEVMADPDVRKVIYKYNLNDDVISHLITGVHKYFIKTLQDNNLMGSCPVALEFIQSMQAKNFTIEDLFILCIHIREALYKEIIHDTSLMAQLSDNASLIDVVEEVLLEINTIFDANLSSLLKSYYAILTSLLAQYNNALDASNIVSKTDTQGKITFVNEEFCRISGYTRQELIGKSHNIVRHPHTPSLTFQEMWKTILAGKIWKGKIENLTKSGKSYYVDATIIPIMDNNGMVKEFIGIRHDITELITHQKQMEVMREKLLNQSVSKAFSIQYQHVVNAIPLPSVILTHDDYPLVANSPFWSFFQSEKGASIQKDLTEKKRTFGSLLKKTEECISDSPLISWKEIAFSLEEGQCIQVCFIDEIGARYDLKISTLHHQSELYHLCVMRPKEI